MQTERIEGKKSRTGAVVTAIALALSAVLTGMMLFGLLRFAGSGSQNGKALTSAPDLLGKFDRYATNRASAALEGAFSIRQVFWLDDQDMVAPKPDPACYGEASSPEELAWLEEAAAPLLEGQKLYFGPDTVLCPGSKVRYYLDDTILAVTWKEAVGHVVFTFSEVKIAHGSQLRRFLAGGEFGSEKRFVTTDMAKNVNAVVASSGDFYKFRYAGVVVYENAVRRINTSGVDTCYIDENGDLSFTYRNTPFTAEEAQQYVDDNHIRFSLTFGPILVDEGVRCEPGDYDLGEVNQNCPRAALCQMDKLHYLLATSNSEPDYPGSLTIHQFADRIAATGCRKGYALDGGQTAAIAMDGQLINSVLFGQQRPISDIIYFATAIPDGG